MISRLALFFAVTCTSVAAQHAAPEVPAKLQFADITLTIRDDARREIQKDVESYTRYPKSYMVKVERARTYFPIIEKIFAEENVPDDFKYLVLQESALIPDAVSVSNAVGFWQFKDFTAVEMGLRVDKEIDERMNIVSATRAAARYLKKNNTMFFNNWLYTLQSYQMGAGGVMRSEKDTRSGAKHMEVTSSTYWYVKKYLAHKIAYEGAVKGEGQVRVMAYHNQKPKTLADLAREVSIEEEQLRAYNKWARTGSIPGDRTYAVMIPLTHPGQQVPLPAAAADPTVFASASGHISAGEAKGERIRINGIHAIKALPGETPTTLAQRAQVDLSDFLNWNDISISDPVVGGRFYLLGRKRNRAESAYHTVKQGEDLWTISQRYGVKLKRLRRYNRLRGSDALTPGTTVWLASMKPKEATNAVAGDKVVEVEHTDTFSWTPDPVTPATSTDTKPATKQPEPVKELNSVDTKPSEPIKEVNLPTNVPVVVEETTPAGNSSEQRQVVVPADSIKNLQPIRSSEENITLPKEQTIHSVETPSTHIVKAGETLYAIARQHQLAVMDLVKWNNLDLQQGIKPGQALTLVAPASREAQPLESGERKAIEHEVKPADTVYSIARKYDVTIKELMEWNNKKDFTLSVGEKLKIFKK